jgi:hypothetical protein
VEGLACTDPGVRTPIGTSENFFSLLFLPEGVIVGFPNFAWGFKSPKKMRFGGTPLAPWGFESAEMARKLVRKCLNCLCPLMSMGALAEGLACADPGARIPIGASGFFLLRC